MFWDREDAGMRLAGLLLRLRDADPVVVGLPRGGVPVAYAVARALGAQLDVIVVRKLGVPCQPELGMGAIAEGGIRVVNESVVRQARVSPEELAAVAVREHAELLRRARCFRGSQPRVPLAGRLVILVDDGLATGSTATAACRVLRADGATRVVLAVPVAVQETLARLRREADEVVCLETPRRFLAVGAHYADFSQTSDEHVSALLDDASHLVTGVPSGDTDAEAAKAEAAKAEEAAEADAAAEPVR